MDFVRDDGKCVIIAMDHGASMGVIDGLKNAEGAIRSMSELMASFSRMVPQGGTAISSRRQGCLSY